MLRVADNWFSAQKDCVRLFSITFCSNCCPEKLNPVFDFHQALLSIHLVKMRFICVAVVIYNDDGRPIGLEDVKINTSEEQD